ncbi:MAG: FAD-dependent oxidoreductase [Candidatus Bathyarchaeia archaeon]
MRRREEIKIVVIGLGTGGLYASRYASQYNRRAQITIIEKRSYDMFSPCGIPYAIEGKVKSFEDLKHSVPSTRSLKKLNSHEATKIDPENKRVLVKNLDTGEDFWGDYDSLIIATGSRPRILNIPKAHELHGKGLHVVSTPEEGKALREEALESETAVVVGGGAIGLEIALALKHLGLDVHVTKRSPPPLPKSLDQDMSDIVLDYLNEEGLKIYFGKGIDSVNGDDRVESVTIAGEKIPCDIVVMAVGIDPCTMIAEEAGIETDRGYIITDDHMKTNYPDIYAIGDCALSFSRIDKSPINVALATTAYKQARVAGINAAGGDEIYDGSIGTFVSYMGNLEVSCTGYNTPIAQDHGFDVVSGRVNMTIKPEWMPDAKQISIKVLADSETGKLIGSQAIGETGTDWRMNIIAMAIKEGTTIDELQKIELAYCPAVSELYDPLMVAVDACRRRMEAYRRRKRRKR